MRIVKGSTPGDGHFEPLLERNEHKRYFRYVHRHCPTTKDFDVSLGSVLAEAGKVISSITSSGAVLGGTPCIAGTRIPVYMILDAIEYSGTLNGVLESYPQLTLDQVKDAVRFTKLVMERPVDNQVESAS